MKIVLLPLVEYLSKNYWKKGTCTHFTSNDGKKIQHFIKLSHPNGSYYIEMPKLSLSIKNVPEFSKIMPVYESYTLASEMEIVLTLIEDKTGQQIPLEWWEKVEEYKKTLDNIRQTSPKFFEAMMNREVIYHKL